MSAFSGYRTNVFNFVLQSFGGVFCWIRFRVLLLLPVGAFFVFTIIIFNSAVTPLPLEFNGLYLSCLEIGIHRQKRRPVFRVCGEIK